MSKPSERDVKRAKRLIVEACVNTCEHTYIRPENVYECIAEALAAERMSLPDSVKEALEQAVVVQVDVVGNSIMNVSDRPCFVAKAALRDLKLWQQGTLGAEDGEL